MVSYMRLVHGVRQPFYRMSSKKPSKQQQTRLAVLDARSTTRRRNYQPPPPAFRHEQYSAYTRECTQSEESGELTFCNAVKRHARNAMRCRAVPLLCDAMPRDVIAMPCDVMHCNPMHCNAMPCRTVTMQVPCNAMLGPCYAMLCRAMAIQCHAMPCHAQ